MGEAIVSGSNSPEILEASEHAFDRVAISIEIRREAVLPDAVDLGRDIGRRALALDLVTDGVGIIAFVGVEDFGCAHPVEKGIGGDAIRHLAARQQECDRSAKAIGQGINFRRPPTARAADRLIEFPPFPPDAQR